MFTMDEKLAKGSIAGAGGLRVVFQVEDAGGRVLERNELLAAAAAAAGELGKLFGGADPCCDDCAEKRKTDA